MEFSFEFDDVRTLNVFIRFKIHRFFYVPSSNSNLSQLITFAVVNLTFSEMLKVIVFVGCVNKSKFLNLGFSQHNFQFHYRKMLRRSVLLFFILHDRLHSAVYMSKLLTLDQIRIRIRTDLL